VTGEDAGCLPTRQSRAARGLRDLIGRTRAEYVHWRVSGRDLNPHALDLQICQPRLISGSITADQRLESVSEDRLHQIADALWVLSSFLTMRGNSAVTRLAQGWMLAGVLALDW
jgi:hypothetical protein